MLYRQRLLVFTDTNQTLSGTFDLVYLIFDYVAAWFLQQIVSNVNWQTMDVYLPGKYRLKSKHHYEKKTSSSFDFLVFEVIWKLY